MGILPTDAKELIGATDFPSTFTGVVEVVGGCGDGRTDTGTSTLVALCVSFKALDDDTGVDRADTCAAPPPETPRLF